MVCIADARNALLIWEYHNLFQSHYEKKISSINMFNSIYHRKCKENGLFGIIVDYHRELLESGALSIDKRGFSQQLTIQPVYSIGNNLWTIWNDSAMELDVHTRMRVFHHLKLQIERKAEDECQGFGGFEKLRYKTKDNPASVIIEGICANCSRSILRAFWLPEYMRKAFESYPNGVMNEPCYYCKKDGSLKFPILM
ncbi:MAG: hypothetical protein ACJ71P_14590 [Nitrososphaeraceae archaeon]